jgi:P4 family phage/plasmid primase-like protien
MATKRIKTIKSTNNLSNISVASAPRLELFLNSHKKEKESNLSATNTRISCPQHGIYGATYHIPDNEYDDFLKLVYEEIIAKNKNDYFTESQLPSDGPILVDLDFRYPYECEERYYNKDHIDDLIVIGYLEELKKIYQFDENSEFNIYVLEKTKINRLEEKNLTKDGIHLIIGIKSERKMQLLLRQRMVAKLEEMWGSNLPIVNTWEDVLDKGISQGPTNWQLYGSTKPDYEPYKLTYIYQMTYDTTDEEFIVRTLDAKHDTIDMKSVFPKLSARCNQHPTFFYKSKFIDELNQFQGGDGRSGLERSASGNLSSTNLASLAKMMSRSNQALLRIRNADDLKVELDLFLQMVETETDLKDIYMYTMILPETYYGNGSYDKWIRVGWALRNHDDRLFIVWIAFSAQLPTFDYSSISDLYDKWMGFDLKNPNGLTNRSIMYWAKSDAREKYNEIRKNSVDYLIDKMLGKYEDMDEEAKLDRSGCTDYDIAMVLHHMFRYEYVCVSITNNVWYKFDEPRWIKIDAGTHLRKSISVDLRNLYLKKVNQYIDLRSRLTEGEETTKIKKISKYIEKLLSIAHRLGTTNDKKNIMTEAKELFYDDKFMDKLDSKPHLLCFKNGVVDFKEKIFRRGQPEDYLTKCTNINYIRATEAEHGGIIKEIRDFMHKLFPIAEIHTYMWEFLASTLYGILPDQTWNMLIGAGQNGKSVLMKLMDHVLGEYKGIVPLTLITEKRTKVGGTSPEVLSLKGLRMAVMQEPNENDRVNEGIMKQLVSGMDPIQARGLYMSNAETFYPQFKMVLCSNYFMKIKSTDHGTWRRIRVVDFVSRFTENPVDNDPEFPYQYKIDRTIEERCEQWKEVFASMLVDKVFITEGRVKDCDLVLASSNAYRQSQDYIAEFIGDKVVEDPHGIITKTELTSEFTIWYQSTYGRGGPNVKDVITYMDKKFKKCDKKKVWTGVRINYERAHSHSNATNSTQEEDDGMEVEYQEL